MSHLQNGWWSSTPSLPSNTEVGDFGGEGGAKGSEGRVRLRGNRRALAKTIAVALPEAELFGELQG